ncbi:MAG: hypothetical protein A3J76_03095 [Candidatus Moranbacteria bacterium RBG_13_45_13]|nr:MAG: hypothetical protein A3J76_03095 [Candidatus Moranbacteria bacterium RBG_13_45_13]
MGKLEQEKVGENLSQLVEHRRREVYIGLKRMRVRNKQLEAEAEQRPGAEIYFPELEGVRGDLEKVEKKIKTDLEKK